MRSRLGAFIEDQSGETMIEYVMLGLLLSIIALSIFKA